MKVDILAFGAHPDDVELGCSGTLAKLIKQGKTAGIIDLTQGELGTRGTKEIRAQEAQKAAEILKINGRENLFLEDGFIENTKENQYKIIEKIRQYQPEIVFCNAIQDRHPDHAKASQLVSDACFLSGLPKIITNQQVWRPNFVFHYIQWQELKPDFCFDISDTLAIKLEACLAYKSQFFDENSNEKETAISSKNFLESISYRAKNLGRLIGIEAAEGFTTEKPFTINNFESVL